jgi:NAD(P)-dependent dehydrogenase (short-subunit alcohol dehydrogenase family)
MIDRLADEVDGLRAAFISQEPIARVGTVDEIATAVLWLCSPEAAFRRTCRANRPPSALTCSDGFPAPLHARQP